MLRSALILSAGLLAALCFACVAVVPPPPPAPPPAAAPFLIGSPAPPNAAKLLACTLKVQVLQPGYFPLTSGYGPTDPRAIQQDYPTRSEINRDLSDAFSNAPQMVQNDLCALDGVFIDTTGCSGDLNNCPPTPSSVPPVAWGYRDPSSGKMYIAIPGTLWAGGGNNHAEVLSVYENGVLGDFVRITGGNSSWGMAVPTISSANPDAPWGSVLAALAHELGHVKFMYAIHPNSSHGKNYNFRRLTSCNTGAGGPTINFFDGWDYKPNTKKLFPKYTFRLYQGQQDDAGDNIVEHATEPLLSDFDAQDPNMILFEIYTGVTPTVPPTQVYQGWASFWGAWSPDEDFVETYVLSALQGNVTSLKISININGSSFYYDILTGVAGKSTLMNKLNCLANLPTI